MIPFCAAIFSVDYPEIGDSQHFEPNLILAIYVQIEKRCPELDSLLAPTAYNVKKVVITFIILLKQFSTYLRRSCISMWNC